MKKLVVILTMIGLGITQGHAQFYVGGSFGFTNSKLSLGEGSDDLSGSSFKILPEVGYQYSDDLAFGISTGYVKGYAAFGSFDVTDIKAFGNALLSTAADISADNDLVNIKCLRVAPYLRYTVYRNGAFEFFFDGVVGLNAITFGQKIRSLGGDEDYDVTAIEFGVKPGVALNVSKNVKLLAKIGSLGYQHLSVKDNDISISRFGLDVDGNNMLLGAVVYF
ncbi:outer membrane beta-barrel protein [Prevotella sp. OH937_COT-195]|uniref:outer membrane beta-barrel protein n=1 Tax=Prevotella sp. OH937_COT-195 TaxID=2491051 RepID=UPI000F651394|nr:outer membrane beta-barrel protein [Prevotella sp. OH937_COT-195]RRD02721.1 hypothetical protein EII32_01540 [Prevotella sp. OH937_COT-195]